MDAKGQRPMLVYAPVQTDKTKESALEMMKAFKAFAGDKPMTQVEFDRTKNNTVILWAQPATWPEFFKCWHRQPVTGNP